MRKISVIVISYNEKPYLIRAIESVVALRHDDLHIEIIIGDDGSDDGSLELIGQIENDYSGDNISINHFVMERPEPGTHIFPSFRVSSLIRHALSLATGDYCSILSADDHFCGDSKFINAISFLEKNPDYYSYVSGYRTVGNVQEEFVPVVYSSWLFWGHLDYFHVSCFVFRMIKPEQLLERFCDDTGMVYSVLKLGKCKSDKRIDFEYVQRDTSIFHSQKKCEFLIIEAMIIQDILNDSHPGKGFVFATYSREFRFLRELVTVRKETKDDRYSFYRNEFGKHDHNLLELLTETGSFKNKARRFFFMMKICFCHYSISVIYRIRKLFGHK